ncbi:MAG: hypothetical protein U0694_21025 [Anaerolineae bacterium]
MKRSLKTLLVLALLVLASGAFAWSASADENPYGTFIGPDAILFHDNDTGNIAIWVPYDEEQWIVAISQTADELDALPAVEDENLLVASSGDITLYKLTSGEYQVNNGPDAEGKVHVVVFDSNFNETAHYTYSVYPAEESSD